MDYDYQQEVARAARRRRRAVQMESMPLAQSEGAGDGEPKTSDVLKRRACCSAWVSFVNLLLLVATLVILIVLAVLADFRLSKASSHVSGAVELVNTRLDPESMSALFEAALAGEHVQELMSGSVVGALQQQQTAVMLQQLVAAAVGDALAQLQALPTPPAAATLYTRALPAEAALTDGEGAARTRLRRFADEWSHSKLCAARDRQPCTRLSGLCMALSNCSDAVTCVQAALDACRTTANE
jgi:hypothetical protein